TTTSSKVRAPCCMRCAIRSTGTWSAAPALKSSTVRSSSAGIAARRCPTREAPLSEGARIGTAVSEQVLTRDVAGVQAAEKGTDRAELVGRAQALRRDAPLARIDDRLDRPAVALRRRRGHRAHSIGVEDAGQKAVDRHS